MMIASCPRCRESVQIPTAASSRANVRCPLCLEEFLLAEIIDSLPPVLVVLDDPEGGSALAEPVASVGEYGLAVEGPDKGLELAPAFSLDRSRDAGAPTAAPAARRRKAPTRPQRKKKSAVAEVVKIVLGGVAGLAIAQLLLWWMPWQDWRRDPFDMGPSIARFAPWLVPAKFHGKASGSAPSGSGAPDATNLSPLADASPLSPSGLPERTFDGVDGSPVSPPSGTPKSNPPANKKRPAPPQPTGTDEQPPSETPDPFAPIAELPAGDQPSGLDDDLGLDPAMDLSSDLESDPVVDLETDPAVDPAEAEPAPAPDASNPTPPQTRRLTSAPQVDAAELAAAVGEVQPALDKLAVADTDEAVNLIKQVYRNLTELAELATIAENLPAEDRHQAARLLLSLVEKPDVIPMLGRAGAAWSGAGDRRTSDGILLIGGVVSSSKQGDFYRTEVRLPDEKTVAVFSDADPSELAQPDTQVMVVGLVVEQPADHVAGYTGQDPMIIWGPFMRAVPE